MMAPKKSGEGRSWKAEIGTNAGTGSLHVHTSIPHRFYIYLTPGRQDTWTGVFIAVYVANILATPNVTIFYLLR